MRRFFPVKRGEKGYTLVEILIVIAIIGVIAAIATPIYLSQKNKATAATVQADLNKAAVILEQLRERNDGDYIYNDYWDKRVPNVDPAHAVPSNTNLLISNSGPSNLVPNDTTAAQKAKGITIASRKAALSEIKTSKGVTVYLPMARKGTCVIGYVSGVANTTYHFDLIKRRLGAGNCPALPGAPTEQPDPGTTSMILSGTGTETIMLEAMSINRSGVLSVAGGTPAYKYVIKNPGAEVSATKSRIKLNASTGLSDNGYLELTSDGKWSISNVNRLGSITVQIEVTDRFGEKVSGTKRFVATPQGSLLEKPSLEVTMNAGGDGQAVFTSINHATQYRLEYSTESASTGWQTALTHTNIINGVARYEVALLASFMPEPGKTHYYRVRAEAPSSGSAPGDWSDVVSVQGPTLAAPSLTATKLGKDSLGQQVRLDWNRVANAAATYYLYIDGARSGTKVEPGHVLVVPFERTVTYAVAATSPSGATEGPKSNTVSVNTTWATPSITSVTVKNSTAGTTIQWNKPASEWGASNMIIELSTSSTFTSNVTTITAPSNVTTHSLTGTLKQGTYYARAKVNAMGGAVKTSSNKSFSTANFCGDLKAADAGYSTAKLTGHPTHESRAAAVHNAQPIWRASATGGERPGPIYFRKVFYLPTASNVTFTALADDGAEIQLNGSALLNATWSTTPVYTTRSLSAGCHIITAKVSNQEVASWVDYSDSIEDNNPAALIMSVRDAAGNNLALTDTTWKFWSPGGVHYSEPGFVFSSAGWMKARDMGQVLSTGTPWGANPSNWASVAGDGVARYMGSPWGYNIAGSHANTWNYPNGKWTHFRSSGLSLTSSNGRVYIACDDSAYVYLNGTHIGTCNGHASVQTFVANFKGQNFIGISVHNGGSSPNPSMAVVNVYSAPGGTLIRRSDQWWDTTRPTVGNGNSVMSLADNRTPPTVSNDY